MSTDALSKSEIYTDIQGLSDLRRSAHDKSPEAIKAVAQQFEALFTQMMLKSMRDANSAIDDGDLFDNEQTALYQDMYDKQLSLEMSRGKGLGLADMLVRQLQGSVANASGTGTKELNASTTTISVQPKRTNSASVPAPTNQNISKQAAQRANNVSASHAVQKDPVSFDSPESFVKSLWPAAKRAGKVLGVNPRALLAQAALETGWGKAVIRRPDGSSSYNLFNIKADERWNGGRVLKTTLEYRDGVARQEKAPFRAYVSYEQSFEDYVHFLKSQPRYKSALDNARDPASFIHALHEAGYATDPNYADKVEGILGRDVLAQADGLKSGRERSIS